METKSRSQSPTDSQIEEELSLSYSDINSQVEYRWLVRTIQLENIPCTWGKPEVEEYIKKFTDGRSESSGYSETQREEIWMTPMKGVPIRRKPHIKHKFESGEITESLAEVRFEKNEENSTTCVCLATFTTAQDARDANALLQFSKESLDPPIICKLYRPLNIGVLKKSHATRSRSRSPLDAHKRQENKEDVRDSSKVLLLTNLPLTWNKLHIENYMKKHTSYRPDIMDNIQFVYLVKNRWNMPTGKCVIRFTNAEICTVAKFLLRKGPLIEGKKIWVSHDNHNKYCIWKDDGKPDFVAMKLRAKMEMYHKTSAQKNKQHNPVVTIKNWKNNTPVNHQSRANNTNYMGNQNIDGADMLSQPSPMSNELQINETYGLSLDFLNCLDIKPPLGTKVFVGHLSSEYDDEVKIRKLFGHAGMVMSVAIIGNHLGLLKVKVEYDHPVEAVQAISMFHNQEVYGNRLIVQMDRTPNATKRFLPEGLKSFGPGLGVNGLPMKGVRSTLELQSVKNMLLGEIANIKQEISNHGRDDNNSVYSENQTMRQQSQPDTGVSQQVNPNPAVAANPLASLATTLLNPLQNNSLLALGTLLNPQATQVLQLLAQQASGNNLNTVANTSQDQGANVQAASSGWNTGQITDVTQNLLHGHNSNVQSGSNMQVESNIQGGLHMQGGTNLQVGQNMQTGLNPMNIQSTSNMQGGSNIQGAANMQGGHNAMHVQSGSNMQTIPNIQAVHNMQAGPNVQGGPNIQSVHNMQAGPNVQSGPNIQSMHNMQAGPNVQGRPNIQSVHNMQAGPNVQGGPNIQAMQNMQARPNMQGGPNMHSGLNVHSGSNMQGGQNMHSGSNVHSGSNMQGGPNMHSGPNMHGGPNAHRGPNMQPGPSNMPGHTQSYNYDDDRNHKGDNDGSCTVMFNYLPPSVTLHALKTKMEEVGEIKLADMTGPGRAVVVFYHPRDAEACIKLLDRTKVDGQTIDVRFL